MVLTLAVFQNCGEGFKAIDRGFDNLSSSTSLQSLSLNSGEAFFDSSCMDSDVYNACVHYKNPTTHDTVFEGSVGSGPPNNLGVALPTLDDSGYLQNSSFQVTPLSGGRAYSQSGHFKYNSNEMPGASDQVMAYFWAQEFFLFLDSLDPSQNPLRGSNLIIQTEAPYNGWSLDTRTIYLQSDGTNPSLASDGTVIIHFMAEASMGLATNGSIYDLSGTTKHNDCGFFDEAIYINACCTSNLGCSSAVTAGISDYWASRIFQDYPLVGEMADQTNALRNSCGISRDPSLNGNLSSNQAYSACQPSGSQGNVSTMGALFTSILWETRQRLSGNTQQNLDQVVLRLLPLIESDDDFVTILAKIQTIDNSVSGGQVYTAIQREYQQRGLQ